MQTITYILKLMTISEEDSFMGNKIFISYKYKDSDVYPLKNMSEEAWNPTIVRDYVDILQRKLEKENHINKGEKDGEDLSDFKDETIASYLRDKIYDSSVTIVMISPNMKEAGNEDDQWIPWEISYSLKEMNRNGRQKTPNAIIAIVLPDKNNSYDYFVQNNYCHPNCTCRTLFTGRLFTILAKNMFNTRYPNYKNCPNKTVFIGDESYIQSVKWCDFLNDPNYYIDKALEIKTNWNKYEIVKKVS